MNDIFIGYSRSDSAIAERLVQRFQQEGWQVFIDRKTPVGRKWHKEIERELHAARAVVVLWSAASRDSDFVLEEAEYGKRKDILFPAFIERVECPYGFGRIQTADLMGWNHQMEHAGLVQLLASLRVHLNGIGTEPLHSAAPTQPVLKPGQTFRDPLQSGGEGPLLTVIPAGRFVMGSPENEPGRSDDEGPQHEVIIAQPFALGVYAVTFTEYDRFCSATGRKTPDDNDWGRENRPVINVSWHDAQAYRGWLNEQTGQSYRLPSEAEWEYACRAGTQTPFYTGERINSEQANFGKAHGRTLPVGSFPSNKFGLYDMHGNVWEWAQDCWHESYQNAPVDGSAWLEANGGACDRRVVRGGSWNYYPQYLRSAIRLWFLTDVAYLNLGFRIARDF
ncbi:MAG: SUMF1/EgtB/PvdO family nonheme iron enzyme [Nitrosomonas sp.]|uniref:SUMF1/EgtB/PvdO family nonheme iron enzyme n=1 Tax=Nitrosomonas sp. TaxID=42353 RepID=UPI0027374C5F|nr:SUMF1/EgtB/PvdO family nonheme iron enzyme [Nitrosomonas sp.]MDP3664722.1 SUMF1/EgtB/PvdO family nonheme iron enzyme [Nitrosomonas sp.]MDZ4105183.1 SUMF1/EgtB/PvdO family nonheme iron enzyme [Nitrosomonas sp.]